MPKPSHCLSTQLAVSYVMSKLPIITAFVFLFFPASHPQSATPFCTYCECTFESGDGVILDCTSTDMNDLLYDPTFWMDDLNSTFRIVSLKARNGNLDELGQQLQPSPLRMLDLADNKIENIADGAFANLQNMEELDLSNNSLVYLRADVFRGMYWLEEYNPLKSLRILKLSNNKIDYFDENGFKYIDRLEELYLANNPIQTIDSETMAAISSLQFLKVLDLSGCKLENLPDNFLNAPKYLEFLDLSDNDFMKIPAALGMAHALEILRFDTNPLNDLYISNGFPPIPTLKTLHLSHMPNLEVIGPYALGGLKYIERLHMHDNFFLSTIDSKAFDRDSEIDKLLPELQRLYIHNNNLSHISQELLPRWDTVRHINISNNPWICDCRNQWFIERVASINAEEAKRVRCFTPTTLQNFTFYSIKEHTIMLPCLDEVDMYWFVSIVFLISSLLFLTCCFCRRRRIFSRGNVYATLRNRP